MISFSGLCDAYRLSCGSAGKESACNVGDVGLIPGLGRSPGEGKGYHSTILARRIPWTVWQSTPVFVPGKSHGQRSLMGSSPRGHKESDTAERLSTRAHLGKAAGSSVVGQGRMLL